MREDEILIICVLAMLIGSTGMGFAIQRSLYHSRKAFENFTLAIGALNERVAHLEFRVADLEGGSTWEQTPSQPHPWN